MIDHNERKHSSLSASGAERWFNCPGSVALSEGMPDKSSPAALEGTYAHEVLEAFFSTAPGAEKKIQSAPPEMYRYCKKAADFIEGVKRRAGHGCELIVEKKVYLDFIRDDMFGSVDYGVIEHFGNLQVLDFKFGKHLVSPVDNLQLVYYGLGLAHLYDWNFKYVTFTIIQPRARSYDGPSFWQIGILELKQYVRVFKAAVKRVENEPETYVEGKWCFFCKGKAKCPKKQQGKATKAISLFKASPLKGK